MTTQEWHEADQDDADRVRAWPAQDAQEPDLTRTIDYLAHQNMMLSDENVALTAEVARLRADLITRVFG